MRIRVADHGRIRPFLAGIVTFRQDLDLSLQYVRKKIWNAERIFVFFYLYFYLFVFSFVSGTEQKLARPEQFYFTRYRTGELEVNIPTVIVLYLQDSEQLWEDSGAGSGAGEQQAEQSANLDRYSSPTVDSVLDLLWTWSVELSCIRQTEGSPAPDGLKIWVAMWS